MGKTWQATSGRKQLALPIEQSVSQLKQKLSVPPNTQSSCLIHSSVYMNLSIYLYFNQRDQTQATMQIYNAIMESKKKPSGGISVMLSKSSWQWKKCRTRCFNNPPKNMKHNEGVSGIGTSSFQTVVGRWQQLSLSNRSTDQHLKNIRITCLVSQFLKMIKL